MIHYEESFPQRNLQQTTTYQLNTTNKSLFVNIYLSPFALIINNYLFPSEIYILRGKTY